MIYQSETVIVSQIQPSIAQLTLIANGSVNKLDTATMQNLDQALDALLRLKNIQALVINSDKPDFVVGADITEFLDVFAKPKQEIITWLNFANGIFNKISELPFVTISAVSGYALGGGCEFILATDYRIASSNAKIGLPETTLGIIPGFGGTVRLPRLIGADNAIEMICSGKAVKAEQALKLGLIDTIVEERDLLNTAIEFAQNQITTPLDFQTRRKQKQQPLTLSQTEMQMVFSTAKAYANQIVSKHYPAPFVTIESIEQGAMLFANEAVKIETALFANKLAKLDVTKALVGIFVNSQQVKSKAKQAKKTATATKLAAVIGAGIMGGGIAYQSASRGVPIIMKDINQQALDSGMQEAITLLTKQVERKKLTHVEMAKTIAAIFPCLSYAEIKQADLVIEAVTENPDIKTTLLSEVEQNISDQTVLASNTSTIPISYLAKSLRKPERFCGMHFFNPVHKMPLVEVIRGEKTADNTINQVVSYALQMGKMPIVVNDCAGFFVNRVLFPYFAAFCQLLQDGADFTQIDQVMEQEFGFPMGPAHLLDVIGIDTAHHAQQVMAQSYPERMGKQGTNIIDVLFNAKRFGQKNNLGFYRYQANKKNTLDKMFDSNVLPLVQQVTRSNESFSAQEIIQRMMAPMVNEVILCLEEGIIASKAEADIALVYGLGFPAFRGGVFSYIEAQGLAQYVTQAEKYTHLGALYQIPQSLYTQALGAMV